MIQSQPASRTPIRFRARSFLATVLAPTAPVAQWLADLDALGRNAPGFFAGRPVILDLAGLGGAPRDAVAALVADLAERGIAVLGIEGADPAALGPGLPPPLSGGRAAGDVAAPEPAAASRGLIVDGAVRSGQTVLHLAGDVTVVGAVSSGAEVIAGGSIHVYGALRGRAVAGAAGDPEARILCRRFEPELVAIDGLYRVADDLDPGVRGQAVMVRLVDGTLRLDAIEPR